MKNKPILIINADDFGKNTEINSYILDSFRNHKISTATILVNGDGIQDAVKIIKKFKLNRKIGIHLNLNEGYPVSNSSKLLEDRKGLLNLRRKVIIPKKKYREAIYNELKAQIVRAADYGIIPTHLDSHRHVHTSLSIGLIVANLAKKFNVRHIRLARNYACKKLTPKYLYKNIFNLYLKSNFVTTDKFTSLNEFYNINKEKIKIKGIIECMCHLGNSYLGVEDMKIINDENYCKFLNNFTLVSYADLKNYRFGRGKIRA